MTIGTVGAASLSGCAGESDSDSTSSQSDSSSSEETNTESTPNIEAESCETVEEARQEVLVNQDYELPSEGAETQEVFEVREGDRITFDLQSDVHISGEQQETNLIIESPIGGTEFDGRVTEFSNEVGFTTTGDARFILSNAGTKINEQRSELWSDSENLSAGQYYSGWVTLNEGESVDYFIRQLGNGARPKLVIENESRDIIKEESVAELIDGDFTAPEDGDYYFVWENTAAFTSGNWRWEFERVSEVVVPASGNVTIEREFTEEIEVCD